MGPQGNVNFSLKLLMTKSVSSKYTVVGFKLSGHFKFFFDIINVRVTILDAKGLIK